MSTHVREFQKPVTMLLPQRLQRQELVKGEDGRSVLGFEDALMPYRYEDYLAEHVWAYPKWNAEEAWQDAQIRIGDAIAAAGEGELIKFEEVSDWEKFHEANMRAEIKGANAHRVRKMQKAGKSARTPQKEVVANGEAKALAAGEA